MPRCVNALAPFLARLSITSGRHSAECPMEIVTPRAVMASVNDSAPSASAAIVTSFSSPPDSFCNSSIMATSHGRTLAGLWAPT